MRWPRWIATVPWSPALFVGATHVWRSDLSEPGGAASFTLDAASLDACPLRLRWSRLAARPCASALVGRLAASGSDTDQAGERGAPLRAPRARAVTASLRHRPSSCPLASASA